MHFTTSKVVDDTLIRIENNPPDNSEENSQGQEHEPEQILSEVEPV
jgi:hypothetical protein